MPSVRNNESPSLMQGDAEPLLASGVARIYSMRFCPFAERVLLYAAAKNIEVEVVNINLHEKPDWYFKKHLTGKVPAFERDGKVVVDSGIIPEYLDGIYPDSSILPSDPFLRAQQRIVADQLGTLVPAFFGLMDCLKDKLEGEAKDAKINAVLLALDDAEKLLIDDFFGGSSTGYSDWLGYPFFERIFVASVLSPLDGLNSSAFPGSSRWPKLTSWFARLSASPEVKAVAQPTEGNIRFLANIISGRPTYEESP